MHGMDDPAARAKRLEGDLSGLLLDAKILLRSLDGHRDDRAALEAARAEADERTEAVRIVLMALVGAVRPGAIDRRRFQETVRAAAAATPASGPQAARHAVFLAETRRALGIPE